MSNCTRMVFGLVTQAKGEGFHDYRRIYAAFQAATNGSRLA